MKKYLNALQENAFLRHNLVFFVGSMVVAVLNYLYHPILSRMLPPEVFGEVQVLTSLITQIGIVLSVMTLISTNIIVNQKDEAEAHRTVAEIEKVTMYAGIGLLLIVTLFATKIEEALQFSSHWPFILMTSIFLINIPLAFKVAYLRGRQDFAAVSLQNIIAAMGKLGFSVALVFVGFSTLGAIGGMVIAQAVALYYATTKAKALTKSTISTKNSSRNVDFSLLKKEAPYALFVTALLLVVTLQFSLDIIVIKYFFPPAEAGLYAGIATISRIIYYLTGSIAIVLLSSIKIEKPASENLKTLSRSILLTLALGGSATIFFVLFPQLVINLLIGSRYESYASILPKLSLALLGVSLVNLVANYHIALRNYKAVIPIAVGALTTYVLIARNHDSISAVISSFLYGSVVMLLGLCLLTFMSARLKRD